MNAICLTESGKLVLSNNCAVQMGDIDGPVISFKKYLRLEEPLAEESGSFSHVVPYGVENALVADREPDSNARTEQTSNNLQLKEMSISES